MSFINAFFTYLNGRCAKSRARLDLLTSFDCGRSSHATVPGDGGESRASILQSIRFVAFGERRSYHLAESGQFDGAGYLVGCAVECAIKQAVVATPPAAAAPHVHLPQLIEGAKKALQGRRQSSMFQLLRRSAFTQGWQIELRYAGNGAVPADQFQLAGRR